MRKVVAWFTHLLGILVFCLTVWMMCFIGEWLCEHLPNAVFFPLTFLSFACFVVCVLYREG